MKPVSTWRPVGPEGFLKGNGPLEIIVLVLKHLQIFIVFLPPANEVA